MVKTTRFRILKNYTCSILGELLYMIKDSGCNYLFADRKSAPKALEVNKDFYLKVGAVSDYPS